MPHSPAEEGEPENLPSPVTATRPTGMGGYSDPPDGGDTALPETRGETLGANRPRLSRPGQTVGSHYICRTWFADIRKGVPWALRGISDNDTWCRVV